MSKKICWAKKIYAQATPYVQLGGWLVVAVPALYTAFSFFNQVQGQEGKLTEALSRIYTLERNQTQTHEDVTIVKGGIEDLKKQNQQIYNVLIQRH